MAAVVARHNGAFWLTRRGGTKSLPEVGGHGALKGDNWVFAQPLEEELNEGGFYYRSRKLGFSSQLESLIKTF